MNGICCCTVEVTKEEEGTRAAVAGKDANWKDEDRTLRRNDAEMEAMMRAQGVDPREVEEYRFDVPTEFDLTPSELEYNEQNPDIDEMCY